LKAIRLSSAAVEARQVDIFMGKKMIDGLLEKEQLIADQPVRLKYYAKLAGRLAPHVAY
jgi:hypothetical protein